MKKGTQTFLHTYPHASAWRKEIMSLSANAGKSFLNQSPTCFIICLCMIEWIRIAQFLVLTVYSPPPKKKKKKNLFRPLSKTVRFNVLKVIPAGSSGGGKKAFTGLWGDFQFSSMAGYIIVMVFSELENLLKLATTARWLGGSGHC